MSVLHRVEGPPRRRQRGWWGRFERQARRQTRREKQSRRRVGKGDARRGAEPRQRTKGLRHAARASSVAARSPAFRHWRERADATRATRERERRLAARGDATSRRRLKAVRGAAAPTRSKSPGRWARTLRVRLLRDVAGSGAVGPPTRRGGGASRTARAIAATQCRTFGSAPRRRRGRAAPTVRGAFGRSRRRLWRLDGGGRMERSFGDEGEGLVRAQTRVHGGWRAAAPWRRRFARRSARTRGRGSFASEASASESARRHSAPRRFIRRRRARAAVRAARASKAGVAGSRGVVAARRFEAALRAAANGAAPAS